MVKPLALDLCCGKGGWTIGLQKAGWEVWGFDIEHWEGYPGDRFFLEDVRNFKASASVQVSLVCASPPCQEFSYSSFPFKKAREKFTEANPPDRSIWDACVRIAKDLNAPLMLENVRGAQKWMGKAQAHYGSFYLWGNVPVLLPVGRPVKGFQQAVKESRAGKCPLNRVRVTEWKGNVQGKAVFPGECERRKFEGMEHGKMSSHSNARKEWSAKAAMIPEELAFWIGQCFYPRV